ncbi:MAG TPA: hypothetical protein DCP69_12300 [Candidatus Omnitrophica bacterium]|nr:hypothetical protein [Candidatus Omnitrophota bacterium]
MTKPPETLRIALTCADGTLALMTFVTTEYRADGSIAWARLATRGTVDAEIARASVSFDPEQVPVISWRFAEESEIPTDRTYRNAWRDTGTGVEHDMVHARELHRNLLREARAPRLAALDLAYLQADETNAQARKELIAEEKQRLRDITLDPRIEAVQTIAELRVIELPA